MAEKRRLFGWDVGVLALAAAGGGLPRPCGTDSDIRWKPAGSGARAFTIARIGRFAYLKASGRKMAYSPAGGTAGAPLQKPPVSE